MSPLSKIYELVIAILTMTDRNTRRRQATDKKIAETVLQIAVARGPDAVTFSEVSKASRVAKTTLYRRYHDRGEMLGAAANHFTWIPEGRAEAPMTEEGMATSLRQAVEFVESRLGTRAIGRLLASDDAFLQELRERALFPQAEAAKAAFQRGVDAGVLREDIDYSVVVDSLLGGMIVRRAREGGIDHRWADEVVAMIWPLISKQPETVDQH